MSAETKSATYTKGPWELTWRDGGRHIDSSDGQLSMCDERYYPWCPAKDSDWKLISASPDLVEALKAAHDIIESTLAHVSHGGPTRADAEKVLLQTAAALTKAGAR